MAFNWSLVVIFCFGCLWTVSVIRNAYRLATGHEDLDFTQLSAQYGYPSENHTVVTEDGYILTIFRITQSRNCTKEKIKTPVLLINGLLASADCFLDAGVDVGLPFLISDECYDLWLGNARGTYYGRQHVSLDPDTSKEFWDFSTDEIGFYDVPATIDYVLNYTGVQQLNYIGVSQGAGSFFVMCSERPGYCDKAKVLIGLAPATKHTYVRSQAFRMATTLFRDYEKVYQAVGIWEMFWKGLLAPVAKVCQFRPALCEAIISILDAPHPGSISMDSLQKALEHFPAGTSVRNLARFGQSVNGNKYGKFDYGPEKNLQMYGGDPPEFNLTAVTVPCVLLHGKNDGIVDYRDMEWLVTQLPNLKEMVVVADPLWNHLDMVIGFSTFRLSDGKQVKCLISSHDSGTEFGRALSDGQYCGVNGVQSAGQRPVAVTVYLSILLVTTTKWI